MSVRLEIIARSRLTRARRGRVITPSGSFETPAFMPVGTRGSVKGLFPGMVADTGAQIILGNTYHLMLRPGADLIEKLGGLHRFTGWPGPMLTDSGGYQAYSMAGINRVDDDGVTFKSIIDGATIKMTPESAVRVQNQLGADIIMAFDDCPPSVDPEAGPTNQTRLRLAVQRDQQQQQRTRPTLPTESDRASTKARRLGVYDHAARLELANERTIRWLERCRDEHYRIGEQDRRALFGIVQGGTDLAQRTWSAQRVCGVELPGYAIGGVAVGEQFDDIRRVVEHTAPLLPEDKPRYLMGVGYERDLLAAVRAGVDMFDCVLPTRNGRNANAFTSTGQIRLRNAQFAEDDRPIEPGCDCPVCSPGASSRRETTPNTDRISSRTWASQSDQPFSRAYIRHLFFAQEMLGPILVSLHNLRHFQRFMSDVRETVDTDDWTGLVRRWPIAKDGGPES